MCATSDRLTVLSESAELLDLVAKEVQEEEQLNELESQQPRNDNDNTTD